MSTRHLLIVYHTQSGNTGRLAEAAWEGATDDEVTDVEVRMVKAADAGPADLLWADALLLGTPENFGYMSGGMKDFLDRTFYPVEGKIQALPYAIFISAGNDGTGAVRANPPDRERLSLQRGAGADHRQGCPTEAHLRSGRELGMALAIGLEAGISEPPIKKPATEESPPRFLSLPAKAGPQSQFIL